MIKKTNDVQTALTVEDKVLPLTYHLGKQSHNKQSTAGMLDCIVKTCATRKLIRPAKMTWRSIGRFSQSELKLSLDEETTNEQFAAAFMDGVAVYASLGHSFEGRNIRSQLLNLARQY